MKSGFSDVLIGLQYGDEGKAKVIDLIAQDYDIIARFNGGANAGHTIETERGRLALHQIPSGVFYPNMLLYIGSGCVVNVEKLVAEIAHIDQLGLRVGDRLHISSQASLVQPHHIVLDEITGGSIGTTKNGIGPAYADKALRMEKSRLLNIRLGDFLEDPEACATAMQKNLEHVGGKNAHEAVHKVRQAFEKIREYIVADTLFLERRVRGGARVLFEGAQSCMLDVTRGSVPYVTSSSTVAGAAYVGGDLSPRFHRRTIGVAKAIMSRVGNGPFASEFGGEQSEKYCMEGGGNAHNKEFEKKTYDAAALLKSPNDFEVGIALRMIGNEYGTVTGRPRRVGMFDLMELAHAVQMNGVDVIFLTKCDLLRDFSKTHFDGIPVVTGYTLNGKKIEYVPASNMAYRKVKATVETRPGFANGIEKVKKWKDLPRELGDFLSEIEKFCGCSLLGIGVGPEREAYVMKK